MSTSRNTQPPMPSNDDRRERGQTRPHAFHGRNPAGSKLLRKFAKARTGTRMKYGEAWLYYDSLEQPKYRRGRDPKRERDALHAYVAAIQARAA